MAGGDLIQFNVAFPGTCARIFPVAHQVLLLLLAWSGVYWTGLLWYVGWEAGSGYFCPLGGTG